MLTYRHDTDYQEFEFSEKPPAEIIGMLKRQGYRWNPKAKLWWRHHGRNLDWLETLGKLVDKTNGVRRPNGPCWICGDSNGFFRARGAATPVWCDRCAAERP
jgi:hypothetical protein